MTPALIALDVSNAPKTQAGLACRQLMMGMATASTTTPSMCHTPPSCARRSKASGVGQEGICGVRLGGARRSGEEWDGAEGMCWAGLAWARLGNYYFGGVGVVVTNGVDKSARGKTTSNKPTKQYYTSMDSHCHKANNRLYKAQAGTAAHAVECTSRHHGTRF